MFCRSNRTNHGAMKEFIYKHTDRIQGVLSCFDSHGCFVAILPIMSGRQMAQFFNSSKIRVRELKGFLLQHAIDVAKLEGWPCRSVIAAHAYVTIHFDVLQRLPIAAADCDLVSETLLPVDFHGSARCLHRSHSKPELQGR